MELEVNDYIKNDGKNTHKKYRPSILIDDLPHLDNIQMKDNQEMGHI